MPVITARYPYRKVWRPTGTRYTYVDCGPDMDLITAMHQAKTAFLTEFGALPRRAETVWEIVGVTAGWCVSFLEVKDPA